MRTHDNHTSKSFPIPGYSSKTNPITKKIFSRWDSTRGSRLSNLYELSWTKGHTGIKKQNKKTNNNNNKKTGVKPYLMLSSRIYNFFHTSLLIITTSSSLHLFPNGYITKKSSKAWTHQISIKFKDLPFLLR